MLPAIKKRELAFISFWRGNLYGGSGFAYDSIPFQATALRRQKYPQKGWISAAFTGTNQNKNPYNFA
jgi:hypothetical protein